MADCADAALEDAFGVYPVDSSRSWDPGWDPEDMAGDVPAYPNIWTDGSRDKDLDALVGVAGAGAFVWSVPWFFDGRPWGHAQDLELADDASRVFFHGLWLAPDGAACGVLRELSLPFKLFCLYTWALTNVCNNVGRILDGWSWPSLCLCMDGDLLACIIGMLRYRSSNSVKVSNVKGPRQGCHGG